MKTVKTQFGSWVLNDMMSYDYLTFLNNNSIGTWTYEKLCSYVKKTLIFNKKRLIKNIFYFNIKIFSLSPIILTEFEGTNRQNRLFTLLSKQVALT